MHKKFTIGLFLSSILLSSNLFAGESDDEPNDFMDFTFDYGNNYLNSLMDIESTDQTEINLNIQNRMNTYIGEISPIENEENLIKDAEKIFNSLLNEPYDHEKFLALRRIVIKTFNNNNLFIIENYRNFISTLENVKQNGRLIVIKAAKMLQNDLLNLIQSPDGMNEFCAIIEVLKKFNKNEIIHLCEIVNLVHTQKKFDAYEYESMLNIFNKIEQKKRIPIAHMLKTLQEKHWTLKDYCNTLEYLTENYEHLNNNENFSAIFKEFTKNKENRENATKELLNVFAPKNLAVFIEHLTGMDADEINTIRDFIQQIDIHKQWTEDNYLLIIDLLKPINKNKRINIIKCIIKIKSWDQDNFWSAQYYSYMIKNIKKIEEDIDSLIDLTRTILDPHKKRENDMYSIIALALSRITKDNRALLIEMAKKTYTFEDNEFEYTDFIFAFEKIEKEDYESIYEIAKNLYRKNQKKLYNYSFIIKALKTIKKEKHSIIIDLIKENFPDCHTYSGTELAHIIIDIDMFKQIDQVSYFIKMAKKIISSSDACTGVALGLSQIQEDNRDAVIESAAEFYTNKCDHKDYGEIFLAFSRAAKDDIKPINELAKRIGENKEWNYTYYAEIISLLTIVEKKDRLPLIEEFQSFITQTDAIKEIYDIADYNLCLLKILNHINKYLKKNKEFHIKHFLKNKICLKNIYSLMMYFSYLPENIREQAIKCKNYDTYVLNFDKNDILPDLLLDYWTSIKNNEKAKNDILEYWKNILQSDDQYLSSMLADFIERHYDQLGFVENDEFIQLTIRTQILLDDSDDPKSPYVIHGNLLKKREEQVDFSTFIEWHYFKGQNLDYRISLNPEFFKDLSNIEIDFDTTPIIDQNILHILMQRIKNRISNNPDTTNIILNLTGSSFEGINKGTLNDSDNYLSSLLNAPRHHKIAAQFKCIMQHILSLDSTDGTNNKLSTQEESFLKILCSIIHCRYGKAGAIVEIYAELPYHTKLKTKKGEILNAAIIQRSGADTYEASNFLYDAIQDLVETLFSGTNDLMAEICGVPANQVDQGVHQGLYLRNLIGDLVGSRHDVAFDVSAQLYYENLLALSLQDALDTFYRHANVGLPNLISYIQIKINEFLKQNPRSIIYNQLAVLLSGNNNGTTWILDEHDTPFITEEGVVRILIKIGALKRDKKLFLKHKAH
ncbi:MAG: hypothetical protein Q8L85_03860 [Alphaproteobacteria bacterium]|nr:hypothetical protein [Alphaproteobacteria bacterium]